ncbi:MAG: IS4 family transposase, partial [Chromatiaceae bacterium]
VESEAPADSEPVEWLLLTTVPTRTLDEAIERLGWYAARWNIEVVHRTLKSGCRIEDRRLGDAESLEACLAIDRVVAWRVMHLTKLGGFLGRNGDGHPGATVLWRGLNRLADITETFTIFHPSIPGGP